MPKNVFDTGYQYVIYNYILDPFYREWQITCKQDDDLMPKSTSVTEFFHDPLMDYCYGKKLVILNDSIRGVVSNEEVFWSTLEKSIPDSIGISTSKLHIPIGEKLTELNPLLVLQNANLGKISHYKTISFLQDPYLEMVRHFESFKSKLRAKVRRRESLSDKLKKQVNSFEGSIKVTNSRYMANMYRRYGDFKVIHMGVDSDLFRPLDKKEMRKKYKIPLDKTVKIFVGSTHPVKGFDLITKIIGDDPNVFWILVLKDVKIHNGHNYTVFHKISQAQLAELYNCADLCVSRSITESFGMSLVEAMFCDVPVDTPKTGIFWDWEPDLSYPRRSAFDFGLDKKTWVDNWKGFLSEKLGDRKYEPLVVSN